ncbi:MAG: nuclear transport factor 2 family protein [Acidobacteria bacterium]|nr:nuclear transport factor 2 family protein [Acidobacteriota bacterium]
MKTPALVICIGLLLSGCLTGRSGNGGANRGSGPQSNGSGGGSQTSQPVDTPTPAATPDPLPVIQKLAMDLGTALAQGNADQLENILSDGYLHTNDNGQLVTKVDIIAGVRDGSVKFTSVNIQEVNVRVYGDNVAVVNAIFVGTNAANGSRSNVEDRVTLVADREGDAWRFVSGQTTPMHPIPQNGNTKGSTSGTSGGQGGIMGSGQGNGSQSGSTQQSGSGGPTQ